MLQTICVKCDAAHNICSAVSAVRLISVEREGNKSQAGGEEQIQEVV